MLHRPECKIILDKLQNELPPHFQYHTIEHTLDVYRCAEFLCEHENVHGRDRTLVLLAAIYHDSGYLLQNDNHEAVSCDIARDYLPKHGYTDEEINIICRLIMATKIPQLPQSHLEQLLCDSDLDYLGRDDFFELGEKLCYEMLAIGIITNHQEWDVVQDDFLSQHRFFTKTAIALRQDKKRRNHELIQQKLFS